MSNELRCTHCKREFDSPRGLGMHEPQCGKRLPFIYRIARPFARRRIQELALDLRTHEGKVFEYAVLRFHVDRLEFWSAVLALMGRLYLMFPWTEWTGLTLLGSGSVEATRADAFFLALAVAAILSRRDLIRDYKRHVVDRLDKIARRA
jgi:hypothetical protein